MDAEIARKLLMNELRGTLAKAVLIRTLLHSCFPPSQLDLSSS